MEVSNEKPPSKEPRICSQDLCWDGSPRDAADCSCPKERICPQSLCRDGSARLPDCSCPGDRKGKKGKRTKLMQNDEGLDANLVSDTEEGLDADLVSDTEESDEKPRRKERICPQSLCRDGSARLPDCSCPGDRKGKRG